MKEGKNTLPKTHGIKYLCRAFYFQRTAKFFKKRRFILLENGSEENTLPCVVKKTHGKQYLCRAFYFRRTAKFF
jgi:hypothetical protein